MKLYQFMALASVFFAVSCKTTSVKTEAKDLVRVNDKGQPEVFVKREWIANLSFLSPDVKDFAKLGVKTNTSCFQLVRYLTQESLGSNGTLHVDFSDSPCSAKLKEDVKKTLWVAEMFPGGNSGSFYLAAQNENDFFVVGYIAIEPELKKSQIYNLCYQSSLFQDDSPGEPLAKRNCNLVTNRQGDMIDISLSSDRIKLTNLSPFSRSNEELKPKPQPATDSPITTSGAYNSFLPNHVYYDHWFPKANMWFSSTHATAAMDQCRSYATKLSLDPKYCYKHPSS